MKKIILSFLVLSLLCVAAAIADDLQTFYPLRENLMWRYNTTIQGLLGNITQTSTVVCGAPQTIDGKRVWPLRADVGDQQTSMRIVCDEQGCYDISQATAVGIADPKKPRYFIKLPLTTGTTWSDDTAAQMNMGMPTDAALKMTFRIESTSETVHVPAGTFSGCVKVTGNGQAKVAFAGAQEITMKTTVESWYARDVGLIRQKTTMEGSGEMPFSFTSDMQLECMQTLEEPN